MVIENPYHSDEQERLRLLADGDVRETISSIVDLVFRDFLASFHIELRELKPLLEIAQVGPDVLEKLSIFINFKYSAAQAKLVDGQAQAVLTLLLKKLPIDRKQWNLFLNGVTECVNLQGLPKHISNQDKKIILCYLQTRPIAQWDTLETSNFIASLLGTGLEGVQKTDSENWASAIVIRLIEFLITWVLHNQHQLQKVLIEDLPVATLVNDAELEVELPESWRILATDFIESSTSQLAVSNTVVLLTSLLQRLPAFCDGNDPVSKTNLELEPVQVFLEMRQLGLDLKDWLNVHRSYKAEWMQIRVPRTMSDESLAGRINRRQGVFGDLYLLRHGYNEGDLFRHASNPTIINSFINLTANLSDITRLDILQLRMKNLINLLMQSLDSVVMADEAQQTEWCGWYETFKERLETVVAALENSWSVSLGGELKQKNTLVADTSCAGADFGTEPTLDQLENRAHQ